MRSFGRQCSGLSTRYAVCLRVSSEYSQVTVGLPKCIGNVSVILRLSIGYLSVILYDMVEEEDCVLATAAPCRLLRVSYFMLATGC